VPLPDYVPTDWVDDVTPVDAARMDNIDTAIDGIVGAHNALETRVAAEEAQPDIPPVENGKWLTGAGGALVWADAPGGGGSVEYENAWNPATPYTAGDVVYLNGVEYLAVNPSTGQTPPAPAAPPAVTPIPLVTALPTPLFDGQEIILVDSLTTPTFSWRFRFVNAKPNNKWVFVGGAPASVLVATSESRGNAAYGDLATVGPSFTLPVAGIYDITVACHVQGTNGVVGQAWMAYDIGATPASDNWAFVGIVRTASTAMTSAGQRVYRHAGLGAVAVVSKYKTTAGDAVSFMQRVLEVVPVAVGG
jgi:hypothetical protein